MTTPGRRRAWTLVLVTLGSLSLPRDAAAYWGVTTLDYGGQLTGYARVEQEAWDPDSDWVCIEEADPWCLEGVETFYSVGLEHELRTPTAALHASGAGSSPNGWLQLNLAPHTPTVYGTWTHHGRYFTVEEQYLYVLNPNTWTYDVSYLDVYWVQFGGHSPQVNVPEPSPPPAVVHYVHTDALGSVRLLTDTAGQPVTQCNYIPSGQDWQSTGDVDDCRFAQTERSPDAGAGSWEDLNYAGARYYHSESGRFTSVDPGHVGMNLWDPQTWNGYAYAGNNPLRYVDPTGTDYLISGYAVEPGIFEGSYSDLESAVEGMGMRLDGNSFRGVILGIDSSEAIAQYQQLGLGPRPGGAMPGGAPSGGGPGPGGGAGGGSGPGLLDTARDWFSENRQCLQAVGLAAVTLAGDALFLTGAGAVYRIGAAGVRHVVNADRVARGVAAGRRAVRTNVFAHIMVRSEAVAGVSQVGISTTLGAGLVAADFVGGVETVAAAGALGFETSGWDLVPVIGSGRAIWTAINTC